MSEPTEFRRLLGDKPPSEFRQLLGEPAPKEAEDNNALDNFTHGLYHSLVTGPKADLSYLISTDDEDRRLAGDVLRQAYEEDPVEPGFAGFLGQTIGGIAPTGLAILGSIAFPPAAPALMYGVRGYYATRAVGAGRRAVFEYESEGGKKLTGLGETGVAAGYGVVVFLAESTGLKALRGIADKLAPHALTQIGKAWIKGNAKETAKVILKQTSLVSGGAALIEGLEEGAEQIMTNGIDAFYNEKGRNVEALFKDVPRSMAAGALGGLILGGMSLGVRAPKTLNEVIADEKFKLEAKDQLRNLGTKVTDEQVDATMAVLEGNAAYQGRRVSEFFAGFEAVEGKKRSLATTEFLEDGRALIKVYRADEVDITTIMNQMGRVFRKNLSAEDLVKMEDWAKVKDGKWTQAAENRFARGFERWLRQGDKHGIRYMSPVFKNFRNWFMEVYKKIKNSPIDIDLPPAAEQMFGIIAGEAMQQVPDNPVEWMAKMTSFSKRLSSQAVGALDVQANIDKVVTQRTGKEGHSELGIAIKNHASFQVAVVNKSSRTLANIRALGKKYGFSRKETIRLIEHELPLIYETPSSYNRLNNEERQLMSAAKTMLDEYFESYRLEYNRYLGTEEKEFGFVEGWKARVEDKMQTARDKDDIQAYNAQLIEMAKIKDLKYVHIPYRIWFEQFLSDNPKTGLKALQILAKKDRRTFKIQDLIDAGIIIKEQVKLSEIMFSYSRRAGSDLSLLGIIDAATREGMGLKIEKGKKQDIPDDFVEAPKIAPAFKQFMVHRELRNWINDMTAYSDKVDVLGRFLNITKMAMFGNPLFLPMYDIIQGVMLGSFNPFIQNPVNIVKNLGLAIQDWKNFSPEWERADRLGLRSKPYVNPWGSDKEAFASVMKYGKEWAKDVERLMTPAMIKGAYNISFRIAWTLDGIIRQTSYRYLTSLKDKGGNRKFSDVESAQKGAMYHGDYAGVPRSTRRLLNKGFATPTFKIAMGKLYFNMIRDTYRVAGAITKGELSNTSEDVKMNARALINTLGILMAWHALMLTLGFETDEFGRRYKKNIDTDEGPRELVWTWSGPHNMMLKYLSRAKTALGPEKQNPLLHFFLANKWEYHPLWRALTAAVMNEKETGEKIYNVSDSMYVKTLKQLSYGTIQIAALIRYAAQQVAGEELGMQQERELLAKEVGKAFEMFSRPFTFTYTRTLKEQRIARQAQALIKTLKDEMTRAVLEGTPLPEENVHRMVRRINDVLSNLEAPLQEVQP